MKIHRMIVDLISYHKTEGLNKYNFRFVSSVCSRDKLTPRQKDYLTTLHKKYI